jgi:hypothetical protein
MKHDVSCGGLTAVPLWLSHTLVLGPTMAMLPEQLRTCEHTMPESNS